MIYFIKEDSQDGFFKIGLTCAPVTSRLFSLQNGNPRRLWVVGTTPGGRAEEILTHRRFADFRVFGEWFRDAPEIRAYIEANCRDYQPKPVFYKRKLEDSFWRSGEQKLVADEIGISDAVLCSIVNGRCVVSEKRARKLEAATTLVLGVNRRVPAAAWLRIEEHPAITRG